jgi:hypothetical protein
MGVDSVDSSSRAKAMKNSIDRGVAGRSMMSGDEDLARDRLERLCVVVKKKKKKK